MAECRAIGAIPMSEETTPVEGADVAAPVEETEQKQAVTAEPETAEQTPEETEAEKAAKPKGAEKRIGELTRNWRSAERDRDYWRELALKGQGRPEPEAPKQTGKPTLEQFNFDQDAYNEAVIDYQVEQRLKKQQESQVQLTKQQEAQKAAAEFRGHLSKAAEKYDDFEDVVQDPALPLPQHVIEAVMELGESSGDVLYRLGKDHAKAAEIASMSPRKAAIALGRIEAQLNAPRPATPQISKAPPPPSAVGTRATVTTDPMKLSPEAWAKQRNQQIAERNRRR